MFTTTVPCSAQVRVEVTPVVSLYAPIVDLLSISELKSLRQEIGLAFGSRFTVWMTRRGAVEGSFEYSGSGAVLTARPVSGCECIPVAYSLVASDTTGHVWIVGARALFVVGPHPSSTAFYVLGGPAYIGHSDPNLDLLPLTNLVVRMTATSPGAVVGIGARFMIPRTALAVRTDLESYLYDARFSAQDGGYTWSSSRFQRDVMISIGLSVLPRGVSAR